MKKTFHSVMDERMQPSKVGVLDHFRFRMHGEIILEHHASLFRPAWTQSSLCTCNDLQAKRAVKKDYFKKSKGLWYGWK